MIEFKQTMGVLGGMGPEATLSFYSRVIKKCQEKLGSKYDEDFPHIIINSTQNPDGQLWKNFDESKLKKSLFDNCLLLENAGVDFVAMECIPVLQ
jgi:aspartate racemase